MHAIACHIPTCAQASEACASLQVWLEGPWLPWVRYNLLHFDYFFLALICTHAMHHGWNSRNLLFAL